MCLLCVEIEAKRMRSYEARMARVELRHLIPEEHQKELETIIQLSELGDILEGKLDHVNLRDKPTLEEEIL